jgi:hypothetical protein
MVIEKFQLAKLQFRKIMWGLGADVFVENYKPGILTLVICIIAFLANFSAPYTIVTLYPDFTTILKTTTLWGVYLQVVSWLSKQSRSDRVNMLKSSLEVARCLATALFLR